MAAHRIGQAIIFSSCGFFYLSIFFFFLISSPILSRRILDVHHTSTHGVALLRICNACLKCAARGSLKIQDAKMAKKSPSGHHPTTLSGYIFATKACIDNRKQVVKQQYLIHMSLQYGELRPTSGWDLFASLGHPSKFQRVSRFGGVTGTAWHSSSGRQPNVAALDRGRHLYSAGRPSRWTSAHILVQWYSLCANVYPQLIRGSLSSHESVGWESQYASSCLILWRSVEHFLPRYGDLKVFKMTAIRHFDFVVCLFGRPTKSIWWYLSLWLEVTQ